MLKYLGYLIMLSYLLYLNLREYFGLIMFIFVFIFFSQETYYNMMGFHIYGSSLGGDLISVGLVMLSFWILILMVYCSMKIKNSSKSIFMMLLSLMMVLLFCLFFELNFLGFYLCFESVLIPIFLIVLGWGYQPERLQAGVYMMFYTLFASLPLLIVILLLMHEYGDLNMLNLYYSFWSVTLIMTIMSLLGFLVKLPVFMLHLWLPKAHVEAPIAGSMVLAGILLKMGGYGVIRMSLYLEAKMSILGGVFVGVSLVGMFLLSLVCLRQSDMKALIAYSSVVHMALVLSGLVTMSIFGVMGAFILMVGHGLCSSGMFCLASVNYDRLKSRSLFMNKGLIIMIPNFSLLWFLLMSSNMAAPPSINLLGEIILLGSIFNWSMYCLLGLMLGSFFSACYCLYLYSIVQHGEVSSNLLEMNEVKVNEYILILLHWVPLNLLFLKSEIFLL